MHPRLVIAPLLALYLATGASGFSVLTHEAIIDAAWKDNIVPLLMKRFPDSSEEDLRKAHAYTYGGAIIQDMGYYPFGNSFFSDLDHYVRSGDFIMNLLSEAANLNEYAFALGSLAHYAADNSGHRDAVNKAVAMVYPKLKKRFGAVITYADDKVSHMKVEFAFDVSQVAQGNYAAEAYHDFIGFEVAQALLERAYPKTYGVELSSLLHEDTAIGTYRFTVRSIFPLLTRSAWDLKKNELRQAQPSLTRRKFVYNLSRSSYRKEWGKNYERPGFRARFIALMFHIIPKVGPFRAFAFKPPTPATETLFMASVNETLTQYRMLLAAQGRGDLKLPNRNFDTGEPVKPGKYRLADAAYAKLLDKLNGKPVPADLRQDILAFYSDLDAPFTTKKDPKAWAKVLRDVDTLKAQEPSAVSQPPKQTQ